jgi:hypothetical protein
MLRRSYKTMNILHRLARRAWPARNAGEEQGAKFVSGLEEAFARARDAAGVRNSEIFGATSRVGAWTPGLIDEVVNHLAPVLLGDSSRLYRTPAAPLLALERTLLEQSRGSRSAITSTCRTGRSPRRSLQRSESVVVHAYRDVRETGEVDVEVEQARNGKAIIVRVIDEASAWSRASTAQAWGSDCRSSRRSPTRSACARASAAGLRSRCASRCRRGQVGG